MKTKPAELSTRDLIDLIAKALPPEIGAAYYREMMYCRSLQENEEMLRILRAMQFLTLLMQQVPASVVIERKELERLFANTMKSLEGMLSSSEAQCRELDERLIRLPETIAAGIKPETIAAKINESLNQQFIRSTIPETSRALGVIAERMKGINSEFITTASTLGNSYHGAAEQARRAIENMELTISRAARAAKCAAEELSTTFHQEFRLMLYGLTSLALLVGLLLGGLIIRWVDTPASQPEIKAPITRDELPVKQKSKR